MATSGSFSRTFSDSHSSSFYTTRMLITGTYAVSGRDIKVSVTCKFQAHKTSGYTAKYIWGDASAISATVALKVGSGYIPEDIVLASSKKTKSITAMDAWTDLVTKSTTVTFTMPSGTTSFSLCLDADCYADITANSTKYWSKISTDDYTSVVTGITPTIYTITYNKGAVNSASDIPSSQTKYHGTNVTLSTNNPRILVV